MQGVVLLLHISYAFSLKLLEDRFSNTLSTPEQATCSHVPTALTLKTSETSKLVSDYMAAKDAVIRDKTDASKTEALLNAAASICAAPSQDMFSESVDSCAGYCLGEDSSVSFYQIKDCMVCSDSQCGSRTATCFSNLPKAVPGPKVANVAGQSQTTTAQAFNDPKVVNMEGEAFEIMSTGTFSMLRASTQLTELVAVTATIDRAGSRCGATYIQNASITGAWMQNLDVSRVQVRAAAAVPKNQALEVSLDDAVWVNPTQLHMKNTSAAVGSFELHVQALDVAFTVDSHRIVEGSKKTRRFANFLNLQIKNAHKSFADGISVTGLLGSDSHDEVSRLPSECEGEADVKLLSKVFAGTTDPILLENAGLDVQTYLKARRETVPKN